jgi:RNA polymerase sigma-70 factor (ECF subfamily)
MGFASLNPENEAAAGPLTAAPETSGPDPRRTGDEAAGTALGAPPDGEFIQLFTKHQRRIFLYILSLVPNPVDAEEVLQETNLIIWSKCRQFQAGSNFQAWACQIAHYEVLKFRDRRRREKLRFSDEFVEVLAREAATQADVLEHRRLALVHCLAELKQRDRELIQCRYTPGANGKSVADVLGRPVNSIYQSLGRIRKLLLECVNRRLTAEARS